MVFHAKEEDEKFAAEGSCCRQNLKNEDLTALFGRVRQNIAPKSVRNV